MSGAVAGRGRRQLVGGLAAVGMAPLLGLAGCAGPAGGLGDGRARVLVVGGGYGGATAARYLRLLSGYSVDVMLVEPQPAFVSCPVSNLVLAGNRTLADLTTPYDALASRHGVRLVRDSVSAIDLQKKTATLAGGATVRWDKLVLSPGIDFAWDATAGLRSAHDDGNLLHAWKAGPETVSLRRQLEAMPDGGVYALTVPEAPYRCPPGPYERASMVAAYFRRAKPRSKVLILDANPDVTSKGPLFKKAWAELYPGMVEYRPQHRLTRVAANGSAGAGSAEFDVQEPVKADVLNVLPVMRAGALALQSGLANANGRWCQVNFLNFESTAAKDVHVLGDAILVAPAMPKSGHMANSHAKVAAAAIVAELLGLAPDPQPMLTNVCMSWVGDREAIHVASVHAYDAAKKTFLTVEGSGGVSAQRSETEARHADAWAKNIWADMLG